MHLCVCLLMHMYFPILIVGSNYAGQRVRPTQLKYKLPKIY